MSQILIVEDDRVLERILTLNLVKRGYSVAEADSIESADGLVSIASPPFNLVILDINLPDSSGWELLRRWRARPWFKIPPVIVTSAVRPSEDRVAEFAPAALLLKPFPIDVFLRIVARMLNPQSGNNDASTTDQDDPESFS